ncbi:crotonase/enoyl-CoA hydratase family protein [Streptomyces lonarensis]|uniref:Crotonase/enoyl-CoA hydratase family protein n=2 Tax=Streptomyces lonarensis TaxID=700599 RepID=A0A7X6CYE5_9ACTN|nr:crotonase/enoyl-CoA hydratase family protein [Streptomyces lonarensis]
MESVLVMPEGLRTRREGAVLVITFDRPSRRNAVDQETAERLAAAMSELDADPALRAGVLTGAGGWFSAGMDLKELSAGGRSRVPGRGFAGITEQPPATPLVAAVEGGAWGGGWEIVMACDLVVAADDARFALPEARRGLLPGAGGLFRLTERLPRAVAMEVLLTGGTLTAERAERFGMVNRLCPPGEAESTALALAEEIARCAPLAVRASKRIATEAPGWPADERFARQEPLVAEVKGSDDAKEGVRAFLERREPRWSGR